MSGLMSFAFTLTAVGVLPSICTAWGNSMAQGGPSVILWGWCVCTVFTTVTGCAMAELNARYPSAGSVYTWTAMLAPRQNPDGSPRMSEFQEFCRVTGAGNHPVFWHMLHNAARYLDEPQARNVPTEIKPPADIGRNPNKRSGAAILYDNPRSSPNGRG